MALVTRLKQFGGFNAAAIRRYKRLIFKADLFRARSIMKPLVIQSYMSDGDKWITRNPCGLGNRHRLRDQPLGRMCCRGHVHALASADRAEMAATVACDGRGIWHLHLANLSRSGLHADCPRSPLHRHDPPADHRLMRSRSCLCSGSMSRLVVMSRGGCPARRSVCEYSQSDRNNDCSFHFTSPPPTLRQRVRGSAHHHQSDRAVCAERKPGSAEIRGSAARSRPRRR